MAAKSKTKDANLVNHEIVTLAVYLLGGETKAIDTEHVAVKAAELAPGRYNWRHYPAQINIELVRTFLSDAKKKRCGEYVSGSTNDGWMLTYAGAAFARENVNRLDSGILKRPRQSDAEKKWQKSERSRLLSSNAARKFFDGDIESISSSEITTFFRVDEYVTGTARERKITRIVNAFGDDSELGDAVKTLRDLLTKLEHKE